MNFKDRMVSMTNVKADDETVSMGDKRCKVYSLVAVSYTHLDVYKRQVPISEVCER